MAGARRASGGVARRAPCRSPGSPADTRPRRRSAYYDIFDHSSLRLLLVGPRNLKHISNQQPFIKETTRHRMFSQRCGVREGAILLLTPQKVARRSTRTRPERTARNVLRAPQRANRPPQTGPYSADIQSGLRGERIEALWLRPYATEETGVLLVTLYIQGTESTSRYRVGSAGAVALTPLELPSGGSVRDILFFTTN
ncbi:unnamed protein product [Spodoptera exigua]|nr:unnamed protein product [Spodoptera exigua]